METSNFVVVRTAKAGVHTGYVINLSGESIELKDSRRIWRWRGANTLHEVSLHGVDDNYTRISEPVDHIFLIEVIEVIKCTPTAEKNLKRSRWGG